MAELLETIDSRELSEWMVHFSSHTSEQDWRTARLTQAILAPHVRTVPPLDKLVPRRSFRDEAPMPEAQMMANLALALG